MAVVTHTLVDNSNTPLSGVEVEIVLTVPGDENAYYGDTQIIAHELTKTNSSGQWSVDLIPNGDISPAGTTYVVTHTYEGDQPNDSEEFEVPSGGPHNLADILV